MAISIIDNQALNFRNIGDPSFNDATSDCKIHLDYSQCYNCDDEIQFQVQGNPIGSDLVDDGAMDFDSIVSINTAPITAFHLIDTSNPFGSVQVGMRVVNTITQATAKVTAVNSTSDLTLDTDIFTVVSHIYILSWWWCGTDNSGGWTIGSGRAQSIPPLSGTVDLSEDILEIGKFYKLQFDLIEITFPGAGELNIYLGDSSNDPIALLTSASELGSYSFLGFCETGVDLIFELVTGGTAYQLDNVVCEEISTIGYEIENCNTGVIVFTDLATDNTISYSTISDKIQINLDLLLATGNGYDCTEGCYKVNIIDTSGSAAGITEGTVMFKDTFTDTNGTLIQNHTPDIGTSWSYTHFEPGGPPTVIEIQSNKMVASSGDGNLAWAVGNGNLTTHNQYCTFTISDISSGLGGESTEIWLRGTLSGTVILNGYGIEFDDPGGSSSISMLLIKTDNIGVKTNLSSSIDVGLSDLDVEFILYESTIIVVINGLLVINVTDSDNTGIGSPIIEYDGVVAGFETGGKIDNFIISEAELIPEFESECFSIQEDCGCDLLLTGTNNEDAFNFDFTGLIFNPLVRVSGELRTPTYITDRTNYIDNAGTTTTQYFQSNKTYILHLYDLPEFIHDFIRLLVGMDTFKIDGISYEVNPQDYNPEWQIFRNKEYDHANVNIEIVEKTENNKNKNC